jgi:hypothetical protein
MEYDGAAELEEELDGSGTPLTSSDLVSVVCLEAPLNLSRCEPLLSGAKFPEDILLRECH